MSALRIKATWAARAKVSEVRDELAASLCSLSIMLDEKNISRYRTATGKEFDSLRIPAYYIAEWLAENWWALLYEPRKGDDATQSDYLSRHSLLTAQHGFALPSLLFVPVGRALHIHVTPHQAQFADAEFRAAGFGDVVRADVLSVLEKFVSGCVHEMSRSGISQTPLNRAWNQIKETTPEQADFCELVGSLGLCPYSASDDVTKAIDKLVDSLGIRAARDFCLAAPAEGVVSAVQPTEAIFSSLTNAPSIDLAPFSSIEIPSENLSSPSWTRGLAAAMRVSSRFGIDPSDPNGADHVFERLRVDTRQRIHRSNDDEWLPFVGAINRENTSAQVALLQDNEGDRRFAAARALYLASVSEQKSRRLITKTHTRDQQASRQFAAEILVPREYLRSVSVGMMLHDEQLREIARARRANPDAVYHQANNMGITVYG